MLNLRLARPAAVVDISRITELATIEISPTVISIGCDGHSRDAGAFASREGDV